MTVINFLLANSSLVALSAAFVGMAYYVLRWVQHRDFYEAGDRIPGPRPLPIVGNVLEIIHYGNPIDYAMTRFVDFYKIYGSPIRFWLGRELMVAIMEPSQMEAFLSHKGGKTKPFLYELFEVAAGGVIFTNGQIWEDLRRMFNPTLNSSSVVGYLSIFRVQSGRIAEELGKSGGKFIDPFPVFTNGLIDLAFATHFGVPSNELEEGKFDISEKVKKWLSKTLTRLCIPILHFDSVYALCPDYWNIKKMREEVRKHMMTKIIERMRKRTLLKEEDIGLKKQPNTYLDQVLDWAKVEKENDSKLHFVEHNTFEVLVEISEPIATIICQILYHIAVDERIQRKVRQEINDVVGEEKAITREHICRLPYADMVIKEALRLYSPPITLRSATEDIEIDGHILPKGSTVMICSHYTHRDARYWEKPNEFYPEHFLSEAVAARPKYSFIPFSVGLRKCPGNIFTYWVLKILLIDVLKKFKVETDMPKKGVQQKADFLLNPLNGYSIKFTPREEEAKL